MFLVVVVCLVFTRILIMTGVGISITMLTILRIFSLVGVGIVFAIVIDPVSVLPMPMDVPI